MEKVVYESQSKDWDAITIFKVNVLIGRVNADIDNLAKLVLKNSSKTFSNDPTHTKFEDSFCPESPILDEIVEEVKDIFFKETKIRLSLGTYWGHIHEKNMSTHIHNHSKADFSAVVYLSSPPKSGQITFWPQGDFDSSYRYTIPPEKGKFIIFPGWLRHSVTRTQSNKPRVSLSLNFKAEKES